MANGGLSQGRNITITFTTQDGELSVTRDQIQMFEANPISEIKNWIPLSGINDPTLFISGWSGKIEIGRFDNTLDQYWALTEAAYFNGVNIQGGTIIETITEADGALSQYIYTNVIFRITSMGQWKGNEFVVQTMEFAASRRDPVLTG